MYNDPSLNPAIYRKLAARSHAGNSRLQHRPLTSTRGYAYKEGLSSEIPSTRSLDRKFSGRVGAYGVRSRQNHDARGPIRGCRPQKNSTTGLPSPAVTPPRARDPPFSSIRPPFNCCNRASTRRRWPLLKNCSHRACRDHERCQMYIRTCQRQLENIGSPSYPGRALRLRRLAVEYRLLRGSARGVQQHPRRLPEADYAFYGLALLDSITGRAQECLQNLAKAIELNPRNRLQARADNDFQSMVDDPRFTELLYPEVP